MKKQIIVAGILIGCSCRLLAQSSNETSGTTTGKTTTEATTNDPFVPSMEANLKMLDTAGDPSTYVMLADRFERIARTTPKQWQPFYYAAFCYGVMAVNTQDKSKSDPLADKAAGFLDLAEALDKNNSEISTMRAMVVYARILVDPPGRWETMNKEAADDLARAKQQNPANPRPYLIEATATLRTPEELGGGRAATKPIIEECMKKYQAFVAENTIAPDWGRRSAEKILKAVNPITSR